MSNNQGSRDFAVEDVSDLVSDLAEDADRDGLMREASDLNGIGTFQLKRESMSQHLRESIGQDDRVFISGILGTPVSYWESTEQFEKETDWGMLYSDLQRPIDAEFEVFLPELDYEMENDSAEMYLGDDGETYLAKVQDSECLRRDLECLGFEDFYRCLERNVFGNGNVFVVPQGESKVGESQAIALIEHNGIMHSYDQDYRLSIGNVREVETEIEGQPGKKVEVIGNYGHIGFHYSSEDGEVVAEVSFMDGSEFEKTYEGHMVEGESQTYDDRDWEFGDESDLDPRGITVIHMTYDEE